MRWHLGEPPGELNGGCWSDSTLPFRHKCVQQLRGTRKGWSVFLKLRERQVQFM